MLQMVRSYLSATLSLTCQSSSPSFYSIMTHSKVYEEKQMYYRVLAFQQFFDRIIGLFGVAHVPGRLEGLAQNPALMAVDNEDLGCRSC